MKRAVWASVAVVATCAAGVLAAVLLVGTSSDLPDTGAPVSSTAPVAETEVGAPPAVAKLAAETFLLVHEAGSATTEFGAGTVTVTMSTGGVFRFVDSAAPVDGGRMDPTGVALGAIPQNLPVVVSFDTEAGPVSIFGRLSNAPQADPSTVRYEFTVFDAPGRDSTYTVSSAYEIPETLRNVRVVIAGQLVAE